MTPQLEVTQGDEVGQTYKLKLRTSLGREQDNTIIVLDSKVSRYHAQITLDNGNWLLTDLGSSNHTYLNGTPLVAPTPLQDGDRINIGETELTVRMPVAPDAYTQPSTPVKEEPQAYPGYIKSPTPAPAYRPAPPVAWLAIGLMLLVCLIAGVVVLFTATQLLGQDPVAPVVSETGEDGRVAVNPDTAAHVPAELSLVYEDDFSDSFGGWDDAFDTYTRKVYGNNRYQIEVNSSNLVAWGLANRDVADFEIEVEARLEDGGLDNSYGLLFRFQDRQDFYRFDVSGDGFFLVSKYYEGEWTNLTDWTSSEFINQGVGVSNILKVSAFGPNITVWANGQELASVTDDAMTHGNFGFFASTFGEPYSWVSYDDLRLWVPAGEEDALTLIPTATRPAIALVTPEPTIALPTITPTPTAEPEAADPASTDDETAAADTSEAAETDETVAEATEESETDEPALAAEPTATPIPIPEYASRAQPLARGEAQVTGRIVFPMFDPERQTYDIYVANAADGSDFTMVQENASQPALNADGSEFAYRSWRADQRGLYARPFEGGDAWRFNEFFESAHPQFSPIDNSLMYHSRVGGPEPALYRIVNGQGQVMRRDGFPVQGSTAKWGPEGQQIVYNSCIGSNCGIIISQADGNAPVLLTDNPSDTNPEISPDGATVVFMSQRDGNWDIYTVSAGGGEATPLTSADASDGLPTWSPDGSKIAYVSNRDVTWSIWIMDPDGSNKRLLFPLDTTVDGIVRHDVVNARGWVEETIDWIP